MNLNSPKLISCIILIPLLASIGFNGLWLIIPVFIFFSALSKKSKLVKQEKYTASELNINSEVKIKGLKSILPFILIASIFAINTTALNKLESVDNGFQIYDVVLPFPGTPNETKQNVGGDIIMANYVYSSNSSHLNYASIVYENLPEIEDPTGTILSGFTRGHNVLIERNVQISNKLATYVKLNADTPVSATWNAVAFEYKGNVYVWMVTFEPKDAIGDEDELFLEELQNIEFK